MQMPFPMKVREICKASYSPNNVYDSSNAQMPTFASNPTQNDAAAGLMQVEQQPCRCCCCCCCFCCRRCCFCCPSTPADTAPAIDAAIIALLPPSLATIFIGIADCIFAAATCAFSIIKFAVLCCCCCSALFNEPPPIRIVVGIDAADVVADDDEPEEQDVDDDAADDDDITVIEVAAAAAAVLLFAVAIRWPLFWGLRMMADEFGPAQIVAMQGGGALLVDSGVEYCSYM